MTRGSAQGLLGFYRSSTLCERLRVFFRKWLHPVAPAQVSLNSNRGTIELRERPTRVVHSGIQLAAREPRLDLVG